METLISFFGWIGFAIACIVGVYLLIGVGCCLWLLVVRRDGFMPGLVIAWPVLLLFGWKGSM